MKQENWRDWEFESLHATLVACVGCQFGEEPEKNIDVIRASRSHYGDAVGQRLNLCPDDVVMDIGSGCGFVGRNIAPRVKKLFCVDLSKTFLQYCQQELAEFNNVECHLIDYADFSAVLGRGINKAYSTAVWIHFNFYDMYHYLTALNALLPVGGTVYFDYADPDGIKLGDGVNFRAHSAGYRYDRSSIACCLNYNSREAVKAALDLTGFDLVKWWRMEEDCCSVLVRKASVVQWNTAGVLASPGRDERRLVVAAATNSKSTRKTIGAEVSSEQDVETRARATKYDFSEDLCGHNLPFYKKFLSHLKGAPCRLLEIGSFEGGSTVWLLDNVATHPDAFIDTIDVVEQQRLKPNLIASGRPHQVKFHLGRSADILRTLPLNTYDFAIIDGAHWTINVLEDMVHAFRLLKVGGIMESDDYLWDHPDWNQEGRPKEGIDAFLSIYARKIKILHKKGLIWVQKVADPLWGL